MGEIDVQEKDVPTQTDLSAAANIVYLTPDHTRFVETGGGMLSCEVNGEIHPVVYLHCSFPHTNNRIYISVRTSDNKEVGIIPSIDDYPEETVQLLEKHIRIRYYAPVITKVIRIREEFGYSYWETETTAGPCRFTVRSGNQNVKLVAEDRLLVTDVDGNRFIIEHVSKLSDREYRMVEMCM